MKTTLLKSGIGAVAALVAWAAAPAAVAAPAAPDAAASAPAKPRPKLKPKLAAPAGAKAPGNISTDGGGGSKMPTRPTDAAASAGTR